MIGTTAVPPFVSNEMVYWLISHLAYNVMFSLGIKPKVYAVVKPTLEYQPTKEYPVLVGADGALRADPSVWVISLTALPPFSSKAMVYITTIELEEELEDSLEETLEDSLEEALEELLEETLDSDEVAEALDEALVCDDDDPVSEVVDSDDPEVSPERLRLLKLLQPDSTRDDNKPRNTKESLFFILIPSFREPCHDVNFPSLF